MKIAVTAAGPGLDSQVEPRFGRCPYFIVIDTESMAFEALENPNVALGGGAGIQSAQLLANQAVQVVLTGNCGPNAFATLGAAEIQVIVGVSGTVRQAAEQFNNGVFSGASAANVASHFGMTGQSQTDAPAASPMTMSGGAMGMGQGMGMGRGQGMGRGMGQGGGRGRGMGMAGGSMPQFPVHQMPFEPVTGVSSLVAAVNADACTGCGICQQVCPTGAITLGKAAQIDEKKCNACGRCVAECPQGAIVLKKAS